MKLKNSFRITDVHRMWINQPSSSQPNYELNGERVLAIIPEGSKNKFVTVFFISGSVHSMEIDRLSLSVGWPKHFWKDLNKLIELGS